MSDKDFQHVFSEITEFLENLPEIEFRTNIIINQDDSSIKEFELLFLAFKKEYVLYVLNKTNFPVSDNLSLVYVLCQDVAYKIYKFLESIGHTTSYPRPMEKDEDLKRYAEEMNREFFLELRSAQKLLYMTTIIHEIKKKCGSPIEEELGIRLAEDNIPFVQQIGITEDYPLDSKKHIFTYPDFLIPVPFEPIAIYCDGQAYHEKTAEQATHDKRIDRKLQELGFVVLRFTGIEIRNNLERCVAEVKRHYLGEEYTKTPNEILIKNLTQIDKELLSEWERNFYESMWDYAKQEKPSSIKQERIIKRLMDKTKKHYELSE